MDELGLIKLWKWLLNKNKAKCPRCNFPIIPKEDCENCGQTIKWQTMIKTE